MYSASFLLALIVASSPTTSPPPAEVGPETSPTARLTSVLEAAVDRKPRVDLAGAEIGRALSEDRIATTPEAPSMELQVEGLSSDLGHETNSQTVVRFVRPFRWPGREPSTADVETAGRDWASAADEVARLERVARAGRLWLDAAWTREQEDLAVRRLGRLERALEIQRRRWESGEAAGSDVFQLEAEVGNEKAEAARLVREGERLLSALRVETGTDVGKPRPGDLEALVHDLVPDDPAPDSMAFPAVREANGRAARSRSLAEAARATAWGRPELHVELERVPSLGANDAFTAFGALLSVPLPLGQAGRERRAAANHDLRAADARAELEISELRGRLELARTEERIALDALGALQEPLGRLAEAERSLVGQFRLGAVSYFVYIDGLGRLDALRNQAAELRRRLLGARLERATLLDDPTLFPLPPSSATTSELFP